MTYDYAVFGGVLRADIEFPDLTPAHGAPPDWWLQTMPGPLPVVDDEVLLGRHDIGGVEVRLYRRGAALRLDFHAFGNFLIQENGRRIAWFRGSDPRTEMTRAVVIGPALALALHEAGSFCLHGSAVSIAGSAVALLAPKHHGKSTLALSLVQSGAGLITDDAIAVELGGVPMVRPGVHSVRLWEDAAERLHTASMGGRVVVGAKRTLVDLPSRMLVRASLPLAAVYVLQPMIAESVSSPVRRERLPGQRAVLALASHSKLAGPLVGAAAAGQQLRWAAELARTVPIYVLNTARAFDALPHVVRALFDWHTGGVHEEVVASANGA